MKKAIATVFVLTVLCFPSAGFAFFDPTDLLDLAISASTQETAETPSPAFVSLTTVYNELFGEKELSPGMVKDLWTALEAPDLSYVGDMLDTLSDICAARNVTEAEGLEIGIAKNTRKTRSFAIKMCTAEEFRDEISQGKIAYVHVSSAKTDPAGADITEDLMYKIIRPMTGYGTYRNLANTTLDQMDVAFVVMGMKGDKALVFNGKEEVEMSFEDVVNAANYIVTFSSPDLQVRIEQEQNKSEAEDYLEKIRKEVK